MHLLKKKKMSITALVTIRLLHVFFGAFKEFSI